MAVIGSGPAGIACAYDLVRMAIPVTVFEAAPETGGLLRYGIPEYRLPKKIVDEEIDYVKELGVEIRNNRPVNNIKDLFNRDTRLSIWPPAPATAPDEHPRRG